MRRWVEKTPANRDYLGDIFRRFSQAKVLLTLRDPRALLASQIGLERTRHLRRFSAFLVTRHWLSVARLALRPAPTHPLQLVEYGRLLADPAGTLRQVCEFLDIRFSPEVLTPTKLGRPWNGNSSEDRDFRAIAREPSERWRKLLAPSEVGWIEWHCREWMEALGYAPVFSRRQLRHWAAPVRGETPREYVKSRFYSVFGKPCRTRPN